MAGNTWVLLALSALVVCGLAAPAEGQSRTVANVKVEAGNQTRIDTPVCIDLDGITNAESVWVVETADKRAWTSCQIEPGKPRRLWWVLSGTTEAGQTRVFQILEGSSSLMRVPGVRVEKDDKILKILVGDRAVLRYNHAVVPPPTGQSELYARSGFIHPLWSPAGEVLTRIHPKDHYHHLGIWNPWTKTKFEGRSVDFWNLKDGQGTVRFVKFEKVTEGPVFGGFRATLEHVALKAQGGEKPVLRETLDVRVWNPGGPQKGYYQWDFVTTQRCVASTPLLLEAYRYGGFGFRATEKWKEGNSDYLTSEGKNRKDGHSTRSRWCNVFGPSEKGRAGILFMSHPKNREHPEPMRIWPKGDVFFNFCPIQKKPWTLEPGVDHTLRYRMYVYDGEIDAKKAERVWQDFGNPPEVKLLRTKTE